MYGDKAEILGCYEHFQTYILSPACDCFSLVPQSTGFGTFRLQTTESGGAVTAEAAVEKWGYPWQ